MFSTQTYDAIKKRILDKIAQKLLIDTREGSYTNTLISPTSLELTKAYMSMSDILSLGFIQTNFDSFLDRRVGEFGIYRKPGKKAHGQVKVSGIDGTIIEDGTILIYGELRFIVLNRIELPSENILEVEAEEVGTKYNLLESTKLDLVESNSNIKSLIALTFYGGIDIETDEELRKRFVKVVNNPSTSGNKAHFEEWALEIDGVERAVVTPLWNGNGTVKVMVVGTNNKPLDSSIIENVTTHITENMPIGCKLTVVTPTLLDITVDASIKLAIGYTIDDIKTSLKSELDLYLSEVKDTFVYSKVYGLLASLNGVADIVNITLNNSTSNIAIASDKIPNISSINIGEVV